MPKYQIIVWSEEDLFSQEFEDQLKESDAMLYDGSGFILKGFKLLYAQSVQGIRKELWEKREELKNSIEVDYETGDNKEKDQTIEDTFKDIENLFNIGDEV